jgi:hypothetical protein
MARQKLRRHNNLLVSRQYQAQIDMARDKLGYHKAP